MTSHAVIMDIDHCLRTLRDDRRRHQELLQICRANLHLTGHQLFDAFRGHLDGVTLHSLVSTWDTWRALLSIGPVRTTRKRRSRTASVATHRELVTA